MAGREADIAKCQQELEAFVREAETDITRREKVEEEQRCQLEAKTDIIRQLEVVFVQFCAILFNSVFNFVFNSVFCRVN